MTLAHGASGNLLVLTSVVSRNPRAIYGKPRASLYSTRRQNPQASAQTRSMTIQSILRSLRERWNNSKHEPPPPYEDTSYPSAANDSNLPASGTILGWFKRKKHPVPQWNWTTTQCREWLITICVEFFEMELGESQDLARNFDGYGPTIFVMTRQDWEHLLGRARGLGVHAMVSSSWHAKGAAPKNFGMRGGQIVVSK